MNRRFMSWLAAITAVGAVIRTFGIAAQALTLDELLMFTTANQYWRFGVPRPELPFHPNLRNILYYLSEQLLGPSALALKGWSILFGTASIALLGLLVWRLTRSENAALLAGGLLALDPLSVYMSRSGLQDGWTVFFSLAGIHLALSVLRSRTTRRAVILTFVCGVAFGLGVATKFYVVPIEALTLAFLAATLWRRNPPLAAWTCVTVLITSFLAFMLTYVPWFRSGHSAVEWFAYLQALMESTTAHSISLTDNVDTHAWQWFIKPLVAWQEMQYAAPLPRMALAVANPVTWLSVPVAAAILLWVKRGNRGAMVLLGLFLGSYVPLLVVGRPIWVLSAVSVVPFGFALVGVAADWVTQRIGSNKATLAYVALAVAVSIAFLPGVSGHALEFGYLRTIVRRAAGPQPLIEPIQRQLEQ